MARHGSGERRGRVPSILIVDDDLEQADAAALPFSRVATVKTRTPGDVSESDLAGADVVLIDYVLDDWHPDSESIASHPKDGVALAAVLRSHLAKGATTALAIHSGQLDGLSCGLTPQSHLHLIARINNVEWVFSKKEAENARPRREQVLSLARAIRSLPTKWPANNQSRIRKILENLLGPIPAAWKQRAWQHIEECHPPIHELSPPTYAITFVRWMLCSILPFATFLWDYRYLAARLRVTPGSLERALKEDSSFSRKLAPFAYKGVLHDFLGHRWWRPGIEHFLWSKTKANPFDVDELKRVIAELSRYLEPISLSEPVVPFDETLRPMDDLIELSDAVELRPDDWPSYAGKPWARRDLANEHPRLRSLIAPLSAR